MTLSPVLVLLLWAAPSDGPPDDQIEFVPIQAAPETPSKPMLGVALRDATSAEQAGALIQNVIPGSAAADAGLKPGDIVQAIDTAATPDTQTLLALVANRQVGERIVVKVLRDGGQQEVALTLKPRPAVSSLLIRRDPPRVDGGAIIDEGMTLSGSVKNLANYVVSGNSKIGGSFEMGWAAVLDVELSKETRTFLSVEKDVSLDGLLHITLKGYEPKAGDRFEIVSNAASLTGRFSELMLPPIGKDLRWDLHYDDLTHASDLDSDGKYDVTLLVVERK